MSVFFHLLSSIFKTYRLEYHIERLVDYGLKLNELHSQYSGGVAVPGSPNIYKRLRILQFCAKALEGIKVN